MYIAMNRFRVAKGAEEDFERMWAERDTHLREDHTLYASHTLWQSQDEFLAWTKSDAFRKAHAGAAKKSEGQKSLYLGPPQFEGFEAVQAVTRD